MLFLFDLDGTLISSYMDNPDKDYHRWEALPGRREMLAGLAAAGHQLGLVTNQAAVGLGIVDEADWARKLYRVLEVLDLGVHRRLSIAACYAPPPGMQRSAPGLGWTASEKERLRRKPHPTMILEQMAAHGRGVEETLYVGDRPEDLEAAKRAGCLFKWAWDFFHDGRPADAPAFTPLWPAGPADCERRIRELEAAVFGRRQIDGNARIIRTWHPDGTEMAARNIPKDKGG